MREGGNRGLEVWKKKKKEDGFELSGDYDVKTIRCWTGTVYIQILTCESNCRSIPLCLEKLYNFYFILLAFLFFGFFLLKN